jgi:hypothetical protein
MCGKVDDILSTVDKKPISGPFTLAKNFSKGWDPLGERINEDMEHWHKVGAANPYVQGAGTIVAGIYGGPAGAAGARAAFIRENGGSYEDAAKGAAVTYLGGSAMQGMSSGGEYSDVGGGVDQYGGNAGDYRGATDGFQGGQADGTDYGATQSAPEYSGEANYQGPQDTMLAGDSGGYNGTARPISYSGDSSGGSLGNIQQLNDTGYSPYNPYGTGGPTDMSSSVGQGGNLSYDGTPDTNNLGYDSSLPNAGPQNWWQDMGKMGKLQMYQGGMKTLGGLMDQGPMKSRADDIARQRQAYETQMNSYYAPGSAESKLLQHQMNRKDAAAGRNSQYGTRATDIAAKIATMQAENRQRSLPDLFRMNQTEGQLRGQADAGIYGGASQMATGWGMNQLWG